MVKLLDITGNLCDFLKTQIVCVFFFKRKYNVNKIFTNLCDPGNTSPSIGNADHSFSGVQINFTNRFKVFYKVIEQEKTVFRFSLGET